MEEVLGFRGNDAVELQAAEKINLSLLRILKEACLGSDKLGENLAELPQFDQGGVGVLGEVTLCQCPEAHELCVVFRQESEVRGWLQSRHGGP